MYPQQRSYKVLLVSVTKGKVLELFFGLRSRSRSWKCSMKSSKTPMVTAVMLLLHHTREENGAAGSLFNSQFVDLSYISQIYWGTS